MILEVHSVSHAGYELHFELLMASLSAQETDVEATLQKSSGCLVSVRFRNVATTSSRDNSEG